ncbi:MAG: FAD-dependent oxidoreductase [Eggerthellales bacterium]|nr:FAD-dependent oxidoreductase [Eggerthellales bacterium]
MGVSRRDFIKGSLATGAVAVAGVALASCSPAESGSASAGAGPAGVGEMKHTWEVAPDPITDVTDTKDFDIVIVGAGLAGNSAAEAAARNGASVAVIERTDGIQIHGIDVAAIGSSWKLDNGVDIDIDTACRLLYLWSQQSTNYNLIRTWGERTGEVIDYIEQMTAAQGIKMVSALSKTAKYGWDTLPERWRVYPDAVSFVTDAEPGAVRSDSKTCNWNLGEALYKSATDNGAQYFFNTHAEQLVGDAASGITGVIATAEDGSHVQFNASKGVILATGDISGNQEMVDCWAPMTKRADGIVYTPEGGNTGDGILMGCWAGASLSKSPAAPMVHQYTPSSKSFNLTAFVMSWLAVNERGERYGAEMSFEPYLTDARMNTPDNRSWSIFDANYAKWVQQQWPESYEALLTGIEDEISTRLEDGSLFMADTLEDLASQLGIPADTFKKSVEGYNEAYEKGVDTRYDVPAKFLSEIKTPPFYATPVVCSVLTIPFGLHVDDNSQVCTAEDQPINGLFAIGNVQGDFFGFNYPVHCPGISHGRCVVFGQLVGESLAKDTVLTQLDYE